MSNIENVEPPMLAGIPTSYDLLQVFDLNPKRARPSATPLLMEFPVNPETGPFLVSSTRAVLWIAADAVSRGGGKVRAAVREIEIGSIYREVLDAVATQGREAQWGNVQPRTSEGLAAAVGHLQSYDLHENEILTHPDTSWEAFPKGVGSWVGGLPLVSADWVPVGVAVVLPRDRAYVGFVVFMSETRGVVVLHNASRGLAVLM